MEKKYLDIISNWSSKHSCYFVSKTIHVPGRTCANIRSTMFTNSKFNKIDLYVCQLDDEWFIIRSFPIIKGNVDKYYRCDQIDGVIDCLEGIQKDSLLLERTIDLSPIISNLTNVDEEELFDSILPITDKYMISSKACCFEFDRNTNILAMNSNGICDYEIFPDCEVKHGKIHPLGYYNPTWGYIIELWPKNANPSKYAVDRIANPDSIIKVFNMLNLLRLDSLGLRAEPVKLANHSTNIGSELWGIAIYKKYEI
jgi:hypothetical protein